VINNFGNLLVLGLLGLMCWLGFHFLIARPADVRSEVRSLANQLRAGMQREQVKAKAASCKLCSLDPAATRVTTPWEFGAHNWVLYLHYDAKGRLDGMACRTADSSTERVPDGPQDWGVKP
jgi:hypothetical protein